MALNSQEMTLNSREMTSNNQEMTEEMAFATSAVYETLFNTQKKIFFM